MLQATFEIGDKEYKIIKPSTNLTTDTLHSNIVNNKKANTYYKKPEKKAENIYYF